jgi:aspartate-semialdehyde dehydrogenase
MLHLGFVGWRGMVGSVLMERMKAENDFDGVEPLFFSTSQAGKDGPDVGISVPPVGDAYNLPRYNAHDCLVDAIATAELLLAMVTRNGGRDATRLRDL